MAQVSVSVYQNQFSCSVCLDLLKDPVAIPCGHSYCMSCINTCWDQEDNSGLYHCPLCRQTFTPRPDLARNTILAEVMERLKETRLQAHTPADHYTRPGDVECDVCTGTKDKVVKSCLACLASYCQSDLQPHYEPPALRKHKLIDATGHLQDKVCSHHNKPLEVYCRTDQQCICVLCVMYEHRDHDTVSVGTQRMLIKKQTGETQREFQLRIPTREELQELRETVDSLTRSTQAAVEDSERIFTEMTRIIEKRCLIKDQQKAAISQVLGLMEKLEHKFKDLKRRYSEQGQHSHIENHIHLSTGTQQLNN